MSRQVVLAYMMLLFLVAAHIVLWSATHTVQSRWLNVPPAPSENGVRGFGLGDRQLAYRGLGIMIQNLGDTDGIERPLKDYDYNRLGEWFTLMDKLDPDSRFLPVLASFYFGATQNPKELPPVIDYLEKVGKRDQGDDWRWLMQAVFLARFREHDNAKALMLAQELAQEWRPGRPLWIKEMPAFVMTQTGDRKSAYALMLAVLHDEAGKVQQAELNSTMIFVCTRIISPEEQSQNPLCRTLPKSWLAMPKTN